jgi:hypothetical protein
MNDTFSTGRGERLLAEIIREEDIMTDVTAINEYFAGLNSEGAGRDHMIVQIMGDMGLTLNKATNEYARWARETGVSSPVISYKKEALNWLADNYPVDQWDHEAVRESVAGLQTEFEVKESTARDYCRAYSDQLKVPHPVLNPREAIFSWICENVDHMGRDELRKGLKAYAVNNLGRSPSNANEYVKGLDLHFAIMDSKGA